MQETSEVCSESVHFVALKPSRLSRSIFPDFSWRFLKGWIYMVCELGGHNYSEALEAPHTHSYHFNSCLAKLPPWSSHIVLLETWERIIQAKSVCHGQCTAHLKFFSWKYQKGTCSTSGFRTTLGQAFLQMHAWPPKATSLNWKYMWINFLKGLFYPVLVICWNYMWTSQKEQSE